jgi:hypothetical protein
MPFLSSLLRPLRLDICPDGGRGVPFRAEVAVKVVLTYRVKSNNGSWLPALFFTGRCNRHRVRVRGVVDSMTQPRSSSGRYTVFPKQLTHDKTPWKLQRHSQEGHHSKFSFVFWLTTHDHPFLYVSIRDLAVCAAWVDNRDRVVSEMAGGGENHAMTLLQLSQKPRSREVCDQRE